MTRRIVHYTDDARSPVNGTEGVNDVWQGFRYDFAVLLSEIERAELSRGEKKALCEDLAVLLDGMKEGVNRLYWYTDFMAGWKEGFAEVPVKETPVKKKRGRAEPCGGTAEGLFSDAEGGTEAEPGEDANKGTPVCGDSAEGGTSDESVPGEVFAEDTGTYDETEGEACTNPGEDANKGTPVCGDSAEGGASDESVPGEVFAEDTGTYDETEGEACTNPGEDAKEEDSCGGDEVAEEDAANGAVPGEDAFEGDASGAEENAVTETGTEDAAFMGDPCYASEEEHAAARFRAEHGSWDDEDGDGKPAENAGYLRGGDEKNGGAEDDDRVPEKSEDK